MSKEKDNKVDEKNDPTKVIHEEEDVLDTLEDTKVSTKPQTNKPKSETAKSPLDSPKRGPISGAQRREAINAKFADIVQFQALKTMSPGPRVGSFDWNTETGLDTMVAGKRYSAPRAVVQHLTIQGYVAPFDDSIQGITESNRSRAPYDGVQPTESLLR